VKKAWYCCTNINQQFNSPLLFSFLSAFLNSFKFPIFTKTSPPPMKRAALLLCFFCLTAPVLSAQAPWSLAFEFQAYPTGLIPGLRADYTFGQHHSLHARVGYNWVRHRDLGVQDDERGDGFGGTLGYRYYFREGFRGWFLGGRTGVWRNTMAWQDKDDSGTILSKGVSKIIVVQPTAEAGFLFPLGNSPWFVAPSAAFGVEVNVKTEGAQVGEGLIILLGVSVGRRL
jgi:hypothetical protein